MGSDRDVGDLLGYAASIAGADLGGHRAPRSRRSKLITEEPDHFSSGRTERAEQTRSELNVRVAPLLIRVRPEMVRRNSDLPAILPRRNPPVEVCHFPLGHLQGDVLVGHGDQRSSGPPGRGR